MDDYMASLRSRRSKWEIGLAIGNLLLAAAFVYPYPLLIVGMWISRDIAILALTIWAVPVLLSGGILLYYLPKWVYRLLDDLLNRFLAKKFDSELQRVERLKDEALGTRLASSKVNLRNKIDQSQLRAHRRREQEALSGSLVPLFVEEERLEIDRLRTDQDVLMDLLVETEQLHAQVISRGAEIDRLRLELRSASRSSSRISIAAVFVTAASTLVIAIATLLT